MITRDNDDREDGRLLILSYSCLMHSNLKLVPYQLQLGHYVLERLGQGDDNMGTLADPRRMEESLRGFLRKDTILHRALDDSSTQPMPEDIKRVLVAMQESSTTMVVLSLFFLTLAEWNNARGVFLRALILKAGANKVSRFSFGTCNLIDDL